MTVRSKVPDKIVTALGVRGHTGWAVYVVLAGNTKKPDIVARGRMELCDRSIPGAKQPFHEAESMPFAAAAEYIARCRASTLKLAAKAIDLIHGEARLKACCVLTASGKPLPGLRAILASHTLIHAAEGEFYRDAIDTACVGRNIPVRRVRERDMEREIQSLPVSALEAKSRLAEFGKQVGPPWTQDEKLSALGAWLMLASLPSRRAER